MNAEKISMMIYDYLYEDQVWQSVTVWFISRYGNTIATKHLGDLGLEHLTPTYERVHPDAQDQYDERGRKCVHYLKLVSDKQECELQIREALGDPTQYSFDPPRGLPRWLREEEADAKLAASVPQELDL